MKGTIILVLVFLMVSFIGNAQVKKTKPVQTSQKTASIQYGDKAPEGLNFIIQSAKNVGKNNGGCWDVPGHPKTMKNGQNIQSWSLDEGPDRVYRFKKVQGTRYYKILAGRSSNMVVDISGNKQNNGANIQIWEWNGSDAQLFYVRHMGNGRYKIFNKNNKAICLSGRSSKNGTNVHMWDDHNGPWMEWSFVFPHNHQIYRP